MSRRENLERLLTPRSIVFVGGRELSVAIESARSVGFQGEIRVVNPRRVTPLGGLPDGMAAIRHAGWYGERREALLAAGDLDAPDRTGAHILMRRPSGS